MKLFVAGDLERDGALIEEVLSIMEAARVATCPSCSNEADPIRFGTIELKGPSDQASLPSVLTAEADASDPTSSSELA